MYRRAVLASVGSVLAAGCLSESTPGGVGMEPSSTTPTRKTSTRGTPTTATEPTLRIPDENRCPPFGDQRVVCYQNADSDATLLAEPSTERATLPKATLSFTLTNETGATFTTNYYDWSVWKLVDEEWFRIAPRIVPEPATMLDTGNSHAWNVTVDNTDLGRALPRAEGTESVALAGLGGGTYAFGISGWLEGQSYEDGVGVAARFELAGDPLRLAPTDDLTVVGRDGDEKRVRSSSADAVYVATRVEGVESPPIRKIPEQVVRVTPLRNLLASFEDGVRRVRLDGRESASLGLERRVIEYEGATYRIEEA
ncbi:hypothetical protein [Haladaptatus salinisoli]|uniref:hypothetical protein n=1 Tax=Haladaptatus salinisoli TaxID=2884876 RepID=UPI001D0A4AF8|nr:hypothetical protein [Haladaptatus salinisoli]